MTKPLIAAILIGLISLSVTGQSTEFTYQGRLLDGNLPPTAIYDFQFSLWDSLANGTQAGATQTITGVAVTNGIFTVKLNFGGQFSGDPRFLQIATKPAAGNAYTTLAPRQSITSTPYAIRSLNATNADTAINSLQLGGVAASEYVVTTDPRMTDERNPLPGSSNYIQNQEIAPQSSSNFNISGTGTANIFSALTQYNIGTTRFLSVTGQNNLFAGIGAGSGGVRNSFFGSGAGSSNTFGQDNSFFGSGAGSSNTTGSTNSFFGVGAGGSNTTGDSNSFFGRQSGLSNTVGGENSFFGSGAGFSNTLGNLNSFFGSGAGNANTEGSANSFFGGGAGRSNSIGSNNAFFGRNAGFANTTGNGNSFFGGNAGQANTTGNGNSFFGRNAGLANLTGDGNSFVGNDAGLNNTTGVSNSFFGLSAGAFNTTGGGNSFFGVVAGLKNIAGINNSFFGVLSGNENTNGNDNSFFGVLSGTANTTGTENSFFGFGSGGANSIGANNSFFGRGAGNSNTQGSNNTAIGANSDVSPTATFATAIGAGSVAFDSNTIQLGRPNGEDEVRIAGTLRLPSALPTGGATPVCRNASAQISTCSSSLRYKTNVADFTSGLNLINRLRPVSFNWKQGGMADLGLVAEEVAEAEPLLATYNDKGEVEGVKYDRVGIVLVNAVKEQQQLIETQQKLIDQQQKQIDDLRKLVCSQNPTAEICKEER